MMDQVYKRIIDFYGEQKQKLKAIEEIGELIIGIMNRNLENVIEELADVYNMIFQLMIIYKINSDEIKTFDKASIINPRHIKARGCAKEEMLKLEKRAMITSQLKKELIFFQRRITQDLMGKFNREKMVYAIIETKKYMILYILTNNICFKQVQDLMDSKNQRTIEIIEQEEKRIKEEYRLKSWKGTDL